MPCSDNITLPYVSAILRSLRPSSALDIGIGMGKFGFFFRETCEWNLRDDLHLHGIPKESWRSRLDGIEVCREYITPLQRYLYDEIFIGRAEDIVTNLGDYDLIYLGDVIEHFEKSNGQQLLDVLFKKARLGVLIVTPVGEYEQKGIECNPYEEHKSIWSPADLKRFPCVWVRKEAKRQWIMFISRQRYTLEDPHVRCMSKVPFLRSERCRKKLKQMTGTLVGKKGLEFLIRTKRRLGDWKTNS